MWNQINLIYIGNIFRRAIEDVRTWRGTDIASEHSQLMIDEVKLMLKIHLTTGQTALQRCNKIIFRHTGNLNEFMMTLNNRFHALQDLLRYEDTTMEYKQKGVKQALTRTCQGVPDHKKHYHKKWISFESLYKMYERRNKRTAINYSRRRTENVKARGEYTEAKQQVRKSHWADKQKYVEDLATTVERLQEKEIWNNLMTRRRI